MTEESGGVLHDPGVPAERTAMAWLRTGLVYAGEGGLLLHAGGPAGRLLGSLALTVALAVILVGETRYRRIARCVRAGRSPAAPRELRSLAIVTAALATATAVALAAA